MKDCILRLYRSAVHVGAQWQPGLANVTTPGLVFWGKHDRACPVRFAHELAANTRARRVLELESNHWTLIERPQEVAQALEEHWDAAPQ
jgi:pimeloyl-ACP methyl ester carboxylesterase